MKTWKQIMSILLTVVLIATGIYFVSPEAEEAIASGETTVVSEEGDYVALAKTNVTWSGNAGEAPVANGDYADWLFAGWFTEENCTLETAITAASDVNDTSYAKFIPRDTLNVKFQIANGSVTDIDNNGANATKTSAIRFISSVDSLYYSGIGFQVTPIGQTAGEPYMVNTVYERINSTMSVDGVKKTYEFSPKVVGTESEYFMTAKKEVAANDTTNYRVLACFKTLDGTVVYGDARVVSLQDGNANVLNLTVDKEISGSGTDATVTTYTSAAGTTFASGASYEVLSTEADYTNVRVNLGTLNVDDMTSASKVTIGDATGVYRNYNTSHASTTTNEDGTYVGTADASWYYINPSATEFTIASSADMYGLASIVNLNTDVFTSDTITLVKNVEINKGEAQKSTETGGVPAWVAATGEVTYAWVPIGTSSTKFAGAFEGDGNEISGIYLKAASEGAGFFGYADSTSSICDFKFINSYLTSEYKALGMIGDGSMLRLEDVFVDAVVVGKQQYVGGIVARLNGHGKTTAPAQVIRNCWFDGEVYHNNQAYFSPFIATVMSGANLVIKDCLIAGNTSGTGNWCGGVFGYVKAASNVDIKNVLLTGSVPNGFRRSSIMSCGSSSVAGKMENVYTTTPTTTPLYEYQTPVATQTNVSFKDRSTLLINEQKDLNVLLTLASDEQQSAWICDTSFNKTDRGTPILSKFATWWKERYVITPDTSWYTETENGDTYKLSSAEELYGLAQLSKTYTFEKDTIELDADIYLNEANEERVKAWKAGTDTPVNQWTPIGTSANNFKGKFNGNNHVISGLYLDYKTTAGGFFGYVGNTCEIENFKLVDSYMTTTNTQLGLIGQGYLKRCENVYTNAVMVGNDNTGGFIGRLNGQCTSASDALNDSTSNKQTFRKCWFDGEIYVKDGSSAVAGFAAQVFDPWAYVDFIECLNTGSITGTNASYVGGIVGFNGSTSTFKITDSLVVGEINAPGTTTGGFIGKIQWNLSRLPISNSYTTFSVAYGESTSTKVTWDKATYTKNREYLTTTDVSTLFPDSTAWQNGTVNNGSDRGTPILSYFAQWWTER